MLIRGGVFAQTVRYDFIFAGGGLLKTILIVDDNPDTLACFEDILKLSGYTVITCRDGQTALSAVREGISADLVITDYRMPGMDGLEFVAQLKKDAPSVPVIMSTVNMRSDIYEKALSLGIVEYIVKPVGMNELTRAVETALDGAAKLVMPVPGQRLRSDEIGPRETSGGS